MAAAVVGRIDKPAIRRAAVAVFGPRALASDVPAVAWAAARIVLRGPEEDRVLDGRFDDPAWRRNPVYSRVAGVFAAWEDVARRRAETVAGPWEERARARNVAEVVTGALAPTNFLATNPAAIKRAFDSGGLSLALGARNLGRDLVGNRCMPRTVDRKSFVVGETLACTPGSVIYREEMFEVIRYHSAAAEVHARPLLMVPPPFSRYYAMDLAPGRSLVEAATAAGIQVFSVVWRNPQRELGHGAWGLDDYVRACVRAIEVVTEVGGGVDLNMLSVCSGGVLAALTAAHLGATGSRLINAAAFVVTMLFNAPENVVGMVATPDVRRRLDRLAEAEEVIDRSVFLHGFAWLRPQDLVFRYLVSGWLLGEEPPNFDILAWNGDATNGSARLVRDIIELATRGADAPEQVRVLGRPLDFGRVECDTFHVAGRNDHLLSWRACYTTTQLFSRRNDFVLARAGHIQSLVDPPATSRSGYWSGPPPGPDPDEWLGNAEHVVGSWWPRWIEWTRERSGELVPAVTQDASRWPVISAAPGDYVHE